MSNPTFSSRLESTSKEITFFSLNGDSFDGFGFSWEKMTDHMVTTNQWLNVDETTGLVPNTGGVLAGCAKPKTVAELLALFLFVQLNYWANSKWLNSTNQKDLVCCCKSVVDQMANGTPISYNCVRTQVYLANVAAEAVVWEALMMSTLKWTYNLANKHSSHFRRLQYLAKPVMDCCLPGSKWRDVNVRLAGSPLLRVGVQDEKEATTMKDLVFVETF